MTTDIKWRKCDKRHALANKYDYFVQGSRRKYWRDPYRDLTKKLQETFGDHETRVEVEGKWYSHKYVKNEDWYIDMKRCRIYISEKGLILYSLKN